MSSASLSPGTVRTVIGRICLLLPMITLPASSSERSDAPTEPATHDEKSPDLLTNSERVVHVLEAHDGRLWQTDIVTQTGWSKAKVSRVLSEMEASGEIVRFRVGRQKVVCLTEATPESPVDPQEATALV